MRTFWTVPTRGATLQELTAVFPDNERLAALIKVYGPHARSGLGISSTIGNTKYENRHGQWYEVPSGINAPEELDILRLESPIFEGHLKVYQRETRLEIK